MNSVGQLTLSLDIVTNQAMSALKNLENQMKNIGKSAEGIGDELNKSIKNLKVDDVEGKAKIDVDKDYLNQSLGTAKNLISTYFSARTIMAIVKVAVDAGEIDYRALDGKIAGDMSKKEFKEVKAGYKLTAADNAIDYSEVVDAANDALSNDISKNEINGVMELGAHLSIANSSDISSATGVLTAIKNSLDLDYSDLQGVADMLTKANYDLGKVDLSALNDGLEKNSSLLASGKISLSEYLAAAEVLTSQGVGQAETQTFIGSYLNTIMQASDETKKWAKENYNLDFSMKHLKNVGLGQFQKEIMQKTGGNENALAKLFGNLRGEKAFESLAKGADKYDKALQSLTKSQGYMNKIVNEKKDDPYFQYQQSVEKLKVSLQNLGAALSPVLSVLADAFNFLANIISNIPTPVLQVITVFIIGVSIFSIFRNAVDGVSSIISGGLIPSLGNGGTALSGFVGKGLLVVAFIATLVYAIWFLYKNWDFIWGGITTIGSLAYAAIAKQMQMICWLVETTVDACLSKIESIYNALSKATTWAKNKFTGSNEAAKEIKLTTGHKVSNKIGDSVSTVLKKNDDYVGSINKKHFGSEIPGKDAKLDFNPFDDIMDFFNKANKDASSFLDKDYSISNKLLEGVDTGDIKDAINNAGNGLNSGKNKKGTSSGNKGLSNTKSNVDDLTDSVDDDRKSWDDLKTSLEQIADSFDDVAAKFEKMTYKVVNSTDLLKNAQYNLQITTQFKDIRDKLLNNSNISGYALNYIAGLDASNLGELKALLGLSNADLSAWNSAMNSMNSINTIEAGKTTVIQNNYEINRVSNEKEIVDYIHAVGKKQGWAK